MSALSLLFVIRTTSTGVPSCTGTCHTDRPTPIASGGPPLSPAILSRRRRRVSSTRMRQPDRPCSSANRHENPRRSRQPQSFEPFRLEILDAEEVREPTDRLARPRGRLELAALHGLVQCRRSILLDRLSFRNPRSRSRACVLARKSKTVEQTRYTTRVAFFDLPSASRIRRAADKALAAVGTPIVRVTNTPVLCIFAHPAPRPCPSTTCEAPIPQMPSTTVAVSTLRARVGPSGRGRGVHRLPPLV